MALYEDPDLALPLPGKWAQRAALAASISLVSGLALAVGIFVPPHSTDIQACRRTAAGAYPGEVRLASAREAGSGTAKTTRVRLYIEARDGRETVVICEGQAGRILRAIDVDAP